MKCAAILGAAALAALVTVPASAGSRFVTEPADADATPAVRYAALSSGDCLAELTKRGVPFSPLDATKGVDTPVRLTGPVHGVTFRPVLGDIPAEQDIRTIADCRLALAVDDLATLLHDHDVVEADYYTMYRKRGLGFVRPGKRHPGGRAIDLVRVELRTGETYSVQGDFHGRLGATTCGAKAAKPTKETPGAAFWRGIVCALDEERSFNLLLTPNHDSGHRDHFHMEVRSGIKWFLIH